MNRYFSSFALAGFIYTLLGGIVFYFFIYSINYENKKNKNQINKISFSIIQQIKKIPKPIIKPKKKKIPKPTKKIVKKKIIKKKLKPIPIKKKYVKKIIPKKLRKKEEIVVTKIEEKIIPIIHKEPINTKALKEQKKLAELKVLEKLRKKEIYLKNIREKINKNKSYPRIARKGHIQGNVQVSFTISPNGKLLSYEIINGKKVFHKSITKALHKTFPFPIDKGIFSSNLTVNIEIIYALI